MSKELIAILLICALLLVPAVAVIYQELTKEEPKTPVNVLCEVGHANPDGSITLSEDQAGSYDYTIVATTQGIKVLAPCN